MDKTPFKVVVRSRTANPEEKPFERSFDQETVTIGRATASDVLLKDARRAVSSRHAEIRRIGKKFVLMDLGSTNGTCLNGQRLDPGFEYPLLQGDEIRIGDFGIQFYSVALPDELTHSAKPREMATCLVNETDKYEHLDEKLRLLYAESIGLPNEKRQGLILDALREGIRGLGASKAFPVIEYLQKKFPDPEYQPQLGARAIEKSEGVSEKEIEKSRTANEWLCAFAKKYVQGLDELTPDLVEAVMERMDAVFQVMINCLADAINGRRQCEREFEVEATRILSWSPNPIKLAERQDQIAQYLLDVQKQKDTKKVVAELEEVFRDLALHQIGLVAGFRECLRGLLNHVDPQSFEAEARADAIHLGPLKLPFEFSLFLRSAAWLKFKEKHRKLSEEEVKVFEHILAPHFARGYLSIQKTKARP